MKYIFIFIYMYYSLLKYFFDFFINLLIFPSKLIISFQNLEYFHFQKFNLLLNLLIYLRIFWGKRAFYYTISCLLLLLIGLNYFCIEDVDLISIHL